MSDHARWRGHSQQTATCQAEDFSMRFPANTYLVVKDPGTAEDYGFAAVVAQSVPGWSAVMAGYEVHDAWKAGMPITLSREDLADLQSGLEAQVDHETAKTAAVLAEGVAMAKFARQVSIAIANRLGLADQGTVDTIASEVDDALAALSVALQDSGVGASDDDIDHYKAFEGVCLHLADLYENGE